MNEYDNPNEDWDDGEILERAAKQKGKTFHLPNSEELAKATGLTQQEVEDSLNNLEKHGIISINTPKKQKKPKRYR